MPPIGQAGDAWLQSMPLPGLRSGPWRSQPCQAALRRHCGLGPGWSRSGAAATTRSPGGVAERALLVYDVALGGTARRTGCDRLGDETAGVVPATPRAARCTLPVLPSPPAHYHPVDDLVSNRRGS